MKALWPISLRCWGLARWWSQPAVFFGLLAWNQHVLGFKIWCIYIVYIQCIYIWDLYGYINPYENGLMTIPNYEYTIRLLTRLVPYELTYVHFMTQPRTLVGSVHFYGTHGSPDHLHWSLPMFSPLSLYQKNWNVGSVITRVLSQLWIFWGHICVLEIPTHSTHHAQS